MSYVKESIYYPKGAGREIAFMLYNYKNINDLIEERKLELIDEIDVRNSAWLKGRNQMSNSLEDIIVKYDDDYKIKRLEQWRILINSMLNLLSNEQIPLEYYFIKYKYFEKLDDKVIMEKMNLTSSELRKMEIQVKWIIYSYALEKKLFREEVISNGKM